LPGTNTSAYYGNPYITDFYDTAALKKANKIKFYKEKDK
jgi:hypothetical protein